MPDLQATALPAPARLLDDADMRVQEIISGHRVIPEQEPFMVVLEALAVCNAKPLGAVAPSESEHEAFTYELRHLRKMRFLVFADRHLEDIDRDKSIPDDAKWNAWKKRVNNQFDPDGDGLDQFTYLDEAFGRDFVSLLQAVRLLRSREIDVMHNRRWTSRFLAVTGPDTVCTDMKEKDPRLEWSADRRFFGRGGELVYLMLNRSSIAGEGGELVNRRFLDPGDPMNRIAKALCDPSEERKSITRIGYLPERHHPSYDRLANDWQGILKLDKLPEGQLFEPLFRITGLNLVVYFAERARDAIGCAEREPIIADLANGHDRQLRRLSKEYFNRHRQAANRAVKAYVEDRAKSDERWNSAVAHEEPNEAQEVIGRLFLYKKLGRFPLPRDHLNSLIYQATRRDKNNIHKYLMPLAKGSGLADSRPRIGTWFNMSDSTIFALVAANVHRTVELRDFVGKLYDRYGLVIGPEEARRAFNRLPVGIQSFEENLSALETRMNRLALTRRLSDDCAFVTNPYSTDHE